MMYESLLVNEKVLLTVKQQGFDLVFTDKRFAFVKVVNRMFTIKTFPYNHIVCLGNMGNYFEFTTTDSKEKFSFYGPEDEVYKIFKAYRG